MKFFFKTLLLLVSYFSTLLLWSPLLYRVWWSPIFSSHFFSSHLSWTSLFVDLLCFPVLWHTSETKRESGFLTELCKHTLILSQTFQSFLSSVQTHLTLLLQWPPAVWQDTQFCQSFSCFQNLWDILLFLFHFCKLSVPNKHRIQQNTYTCMQYTHSYRTHTLKMDVRKSWLVCHKQFCVSFRIEWGICLLNYSTICKFKLRWQTTLKN